LALPDPIMPADLPVAPVAADHQAIVFRVADETYGIEIGFVHEIIRHQPTTGVPGTSTAILGLINLRSRIFPVLSVRTIFGLPEPVPGPRSRIVVVGIDGSRIGLLVDEVSEVRTFSADTIQPPPSFVAGDSQDQIVGIAQTEGGLVILLDVEAVVGSVDLGRTS
jgi:purine-binding chemotaxis protein CheW